MQKVKKSGSAGVAAFSSPDGASDRMIMAMRPAVEAALVAAVAFGCAQAGWAVLTPNTAGASASNDAVSRGEEAGLFTRTEDVVRSPFEPNLAEMNAGSHAANALLTNLQLSGVRVSTDATRSSAVLAMADGAHRAYRVGEEIAEGVRLAEVAADYVLLSYAGGQRQVQMPPAPVSYARALMGEIDAPATTALAAVKSGAASRVAQQALSASDLTPFAPIAPVTASVELPQLAEPAFAAPLLATISATAAPGNVSVSPNALPDVAGWLAQTVTANVAGQEAGGWRLPAELPAIASGLGLKGGDVITAINGADATQAAAAMAAVASAGPLQLTVKRGDAQIAITLPVSAP